MDAHPPQAHVDPVCDTYFGVTIMDPYRWMEDTTAQAFQEWIAAQTAYAHHWLDTQPEHAVLVDEILAARQTTERLGDRKVAGNHLFGLRTAAERAQSWLVCRTLNDGHERVLYDPNDSAHAFYGPLAWYLPSPDGRLVLFDVLTEEHCYHVLDLTTGEIRPLGITEAGYDDGNGRGAPCWLADNAGFFYNKDRMMWLHQLHTTVAEDRLIWGHTTRPDLISADDTAFVAIHPSSDWMLGLVFHGDQHEFSIFYAPLSACTMEAMDIPWQTLATPENGVVGYALDGDTVYLRTHQHAPRYQILAVALSPAARSSAQVLVPASEAVIQGMLVVGTYLVLQDLVGGLTRFRRVSLPDGHITPLPVPMDGSSDLFNNWNSMPMASVSDALYVMLQSWTVAPRLYRYLVSQRQVEDTGWIEHHHPPSTQYRSYQVHVPSHDGIPIPLTIIHLADLIYDGTNPTIVYAYGSYGLAATPIYWADFVPWYARGGVLAVAGVRGGGEYGREWHAAGMGRQKANTIADMLACAEYLIGARIASAQTLAAFGISAGSYPAGGALVRRPALWAAVVIAVGEPNTIRKEQDTGAAVPEIGSITTEDGFAALQITDSYTRVQDGVAYPAVLLQSGAQDSIVPRWQAAKMAARLQAASSSGKPVLLNSITDMGHMPGTEQQWAQIHADMFVFILAAIQDA